MAIYLVTPLAHNADQVRDAVRAALPLENIFELQGRAGYLVSFKGTSVELSNLIGITSPEGVSKSTIGSAMVTSIGSYYGMGSTAMWEWMKTRVESQS